MDALYVINAAADREVHDSIERYAFWEGFCTCSLSDYLGAPELPAGKWAMLYLDKEGAKRLASDTMDLLRLRLPVILISSGPFSFQMFRRHMQLYIEEKTLENRTLCFGGLQICKGRREVRMKDRALKIRGYNYDIFLKLLEHIGEVVTREEINRCLPKRHRRTLRNVDTHIKEIRREIGVKELIRCVRSVGYSIPADRLWETAGMDKKEKYCSVYNQPPVQP